MKIATFPVGLMQANCYFLTDEASGTCLMVDPGDEAPRLLDKLRERGLTLAGILLTHAHFDHMMALEEIRQKTSAPLALHEADAPALSDPSLSLFDRFAHSRETFAPAERLLHDGDTVTLGGETIRVIHTPGHTPGSVCFLAGDRLLTGDTLFRDSVGRHDFPGGDFGQLRASLARLRDLPMEDCRIYPGHGPSTSLARERRFNPYLVQAQS